MERFTSFWRTATVLAIAGAVGCSGIRATPPASQQPLAARMTAPCTWKQQAISRLRRGDVLYDIASVDDYGSSSGSYEDDFAVSVGGFHVNSVAAALGYFGHQWAPEKVVNPSPALNAFFGTGADSHTDVWAVGEYFNSKNHYEPLVERFDGKNWNLIGTPPLAAGGSLTHVNAISPNDVWMSGVALTPTNGFTGLLEHWNGHAVKIERYELLPRPSGNFAFTAAPIYLGSSTHPTNQVFALNQDRLQVTIGAIAVRAKTTQPFSVTPVLPLKGYPFSYVNGILPYDTNGVFTIGYYQKSLTSLPLPMAQWWNGKNFEMLSPPLKGVGASLLDAAYDPLAGVLAVGVYDLNKRTQFPYALAFNGKDWSDALAPRIPGVFSAIAPIAGTKDYWVAFNGNRTPPGIYLAKCNRF